MTRQSSMHRQPSSEATYRFEGRCHCGAIAFTYRTSMPAAQWRVHACQCRFCRAHGARTVADPLGSLEFHVADASKVNCYRFGTRSSDFVVCRQCGAYIAALITVDGAQFATVNINAIDAPLDVPDAEAVSYEGESADARTARRLKRWTPVMRSVIA
jgi:hypothetical protein